MARDVEAQAGLGVVLGAYLNTVIEAVGADLGQRSGVEGVAQFADLLGDAVTAEQAEMIAAATATAAQRGVLAGAIGFASTAVVSSLGAGPLVGLAATRIVKAGTDRLTRPDAATMPDVRLRHVAYDSIIVAAVTLARTDRATQGSHRLHEDDAAGLAQVDAHLERLAQLDAAADAEAYHDEVADMADFIQQRAPRLDTFVNGVLSVPAVSELTERHD